jgi:hypothetical protein
MLKMYMAAVWNKIPFYPQILVSGAAVSAHAADINITNCGMVKFLASTLAVCC